MGRGLGRHNIPVCLRNASYDLSARLRLSRSHYYRVPQPRYGITPRRRRPMRRPLSSSRHSVIGSGSTNHSTVSVRSNLRPRAYRHSVSSGIGVGVSSARPIFHCTGKIAQTLLPSQEFRHRFKPRCLKHGFPSIYPVMSQQGLHHVILTYFQFSIRLLI